MIAEPEVSNSTPLRTDQPITDSLPFYCNFCDQHYRLPRPRACCDRGRQWDMDLQTALAAKNKAGEAEL
jgi:hypothetical protein